MAEMYDAQYPGDEEVNNTQWKDFWVKHQKYHTVCLNCISKRKDSKVTK
jgi:hypothetical protein